MAFDKFKDALIETDTDIRSYLKNSEGYLQLKVFKVLMRLVTAFVQGLLVGSMLLLALFVLALGASYAIGELLDNIWYGFAIVGVFFIFLALLFYLLRKHINKPIITFFSTYYFDKL